LCQLPDDKGRAIGRAIVFSLRRRPPGDSFHAKVTLQLGRQPFWTVLLHCLKSLAIDS
jgi:hypothetical protein